MVGSGAAASAMDSSNQDTNVDNVASVRVAEKAGFHREGTLRRAAAEPDGLHDQAVFSLLSDEI